MSDKIADMQEIADKVDECWDYLVWKMYQSNKDNHIDWQEARTYYGKMYGWIFINNGVELKRIVDSIEPIPKGWTKGIVKNVYKLYVPELDMTFDNKSQLAKYLGVSCQYVGSAVKRGGTVKGYTIEKIIG